MQSALNALEAVGRNPIRFLSTCLTGTRIGKHFCDNFIAVQIIDRPASDPTLSDLPSNVRIEVYKYRHWSLLSRIFGELIVLCRI